MNGKRIEIKYDQTHILGYYLRNKRELELTYKGEERYLQYFCEKFNIQDPTQVTKTLIQTLVPDLEKFGIEFIRSLSLNVSLSSLGYLWSLKIKRQCSRIITVDKIKDYLYGCYEQEYSSLSTGERGVQVIDSNGQQLSNTHYRKAMRLVDNRKAIKISNSKIQLIHPITTEVYYLPLLKETLYVKQNKCCNLCKKEFSRHDLELHHKYIPQTYKIINKKRNTELVCRKCHRKRHDNKFSLVNLLIKFVDLKDFYLNKNNYKGKN